MTTQAHAQLLAAADLGHLAEMSDSDFECHVLPDLRALADRLGDSMHFGDRDRALLLDLCERFSDLVAVADEQPEALGERRVGVATEPRLECAPVIVHDHVDVRPIVEASAFEIAVLERETQRAHEVQGRAGCRAERA